METNVNDCRALLNRFLERWPADKLIEMKLSEYVGLDDPDTFCQWVETKTRLLGSIKGEQSKKFGIYQRRDKSARPAKMISDEKYSWLSEYGRKRGQAFWYIIQDIDFIATNARSGRFDAMEGLPTDHLMAWKVAFLYSNERIVPIFRKSLLYQIAENKGMASPRFKPFWQIYEFIYKTKPPEMDVYSYAAALLIETGKDKPPITTHYVINDDSMVVHRADMNILGLAIAKNERYSELWHASQTEISRVLKKGKEATNITGALKFYFQIKPGDVIALRSTGSSPSAKGKSHITAYAVVVEREGHTYFYDADRGHCVNIEYIKTNIMREVVMSSQRPIVKRIKDERSIENIFQEFKDARKGSVRELIRKRRRKASAGKVVSGHARSGSEGYITDPKHNLIQTLFKEHLLHRFGYNALLEEDFIDVKVVLPTKVILYEVKPYDLAEDCIRAGLGQLLSYSFFDRSEKTKELRIVGPNQPTNEEKKFIKYVKDILSEDFDYIAFQV